MFNNISYDRFGQNKKRAGFNSIKTLKAKKYMTIKLTDETTENDDLFNTIEFEDEHKQIDEIYEDKDTSFTTINELHNTTPIEPLPTINYDHEMLKHKTLLKFYETGKRNSSKKFAKAIL
jgi:hypothetical protein